MAIRRPKIRELGEAIRAIVKGPFTTKFPFEKPEIIPEFRGFPKFVEEECIRCGACAEVCPADVILVEEIKKDGRLFRRLRFRYDICQLCGQCGTLWISDKIGEKAYANPTLLLIKMREAGIVAEDKDLEEPAEMLREDIYKILCPDCRRAAYMKENFL